MQKKTYHITYPIVLISMLMLYVILYHKVSDYVVWYSSGFHVIDDLSEYYAMLREFDFSALFCLALMLAFYVYLSLPLCKKKEKKQIPAKCCTVITIIVLSILLFYLLSFYTQQEIASSQFAILLQVHFLSVFFFKQGFLSFCFFTIALYPVVLLLWNIMKPNKKMMQNEI